MNKLFVIIAILIFVLISTNIAIAQLSPGDLHDSHADLEGLKNCEKCHEAGKKVSTAKCLDCHRLLDDRIKSEKGLHSNEGYDDCVACHVEHLGRDNELIWWVDGRDDFEHKLTGFELSGKHLKLECRKCHIENHIENKEMLLKAGKKLNFTFLGLDQKCVSCHFDEHREQLKNDCLTCHNMEGWKPASGFDHNAVKFKLSGKHVNVECGKCHKPIADSNNPIDSEYIHFSNINHRDCSNCHNDVHQGKFPQSCGNCHSPTGWKNVNTTNFDHTKTKYPLMGKHYDLKCEQCHNVGQPKTGLKHNYCIDCHSDHHKGQFADRTSKGECGECHTVNGFTPSLYTLEMHSKSEYPLKKSHLAVPCFLCHGDQSAEQNMSMTKFKFESTNCKTCHNDPHAGSVDKYISERGCEICHNLSGWPAVSYDHSAHGFKLDGKHAAINCVKCHKPDEHAVKPKTIKFTGLKKECLSCHIDIHRGQFATEIELAGEMTKQTDCRRCHTPGNWFPDLFDHNRDAVFKLEGAHQKAKCNGCHKRIEEQGDTFVWFKPVEKTCESCHAGNNKILEGNRP